MRALESEVFQPLQRVTPQSTEQTQQKLQAFVSSLANSPDATQVTRAANLLLQALRERADYAQRFRQGGTDSRLDVSPLKWHDVDNRAKTIDVTGNARRARNSFFAQAADREWHDRELAYASAIDRLVSSAGLSSR